MSEPLAPEITPEARIGCTLVMDSEPPPVMLMGEELEGREERAGGGNCPTGDADGLGHIAGGHRAVEVKDLVPKVDRSRPVQNHAVQTQRRAEHRNGAAICDGELVQLDFALAASRNRGECMTIQIQHALIGRDHTRDGDGCVIAPTKRCVGGQVDVTSKQGGGG